MYETQSPDTAPEVERALFERYRAMTDEEKLRRVAALGAMVNAFARAGIRERHPGATPREVEMRLLSASLDRATMIRVYGWDPEEKGH